MFVPGSPFQPCLMFAGKVGAFPQKLDWAGKAYQVTMDKHKLLY
jgi:hypothetical protein